MRKIKLLIASAMALLATWPATAQRGPVGDAPNVSVSDRTVMAVYPDAAEFIIHLGRNLATLVVIGPDGEESVEERPAEVSCPQPGCWRADMPGGDWFEVWPDTGTTLLCIGDRQEAYFWP